MAWCGECSAARCAALGSRASLFSLLRPEQMRPLRTAARQCHASVLLLLLLATSCCVAVANASGAGQKQAQRVLLVCAAQPHAQNAAARRGPASCPNSTHNTIARIYKCQGMSMYRGRAAIRTRTEPLLQAWLMRPTRSEMSKTDTLPSLPANATARSHIGEACILG